MANWSNVRSWLGLERPRRLARPSFRPMLEELEARNPPGDLMGAAASLTAPAWASGEMSSASGQAAGSVRLAAPDGNSPSMTGTAATTAPDLGGAAATSTASRGGSKAAASASAPSPILPGADYGNLSEQLALSPAFTSGGHTAAGKAVAAPSGFVPEYLLPLPPPPPKRLTATGLAEASGVASPDAAASGSGAAPAVPLSNAAWSLIGPAPVTGGANVGGNPNFSGRVTGLAADPTNANIIYMAAAGGGVWKTSDGGATWAPLTDTQSTLFMGAIAVAPSNGNVIYAGTGESNNSGDSFYGRGVLVSTDAGATWTLQNNGGAFDRLAFSKIVVDPNNANTVYAAVASQQVNGVAGNTGIWKSTDGGATWTNTTLGITNVNPNSDFTDVVVDPADPTTVYCAIGDIGGGVENGVYESINAGASWAASGNFSGGANDGRISLAVSPLNTNPLGLGGTVYAAVAQTTGAGAGIDFIAKTTDAGTAWTNTTMPPDYMGGQGWYNNVIAVSPTNADRVFVGGGFNGTDANGNFIGQVLESTDGGTTWNDITIGADGNGVHPDHHAMTFDAAGDLIDGNDGGVWRLQSATIGAISWQDLNTNLSTLQSYGVALDPTNANIAYTGTQDNGTNKFTGNLPWMQVRGGDGGFVRVDPSNPLTVYHTFFRLTGSTTFIERSDDGGATWNDISAGINPNDNSDFIVPYQLDKSNPSRLILGTDHLYETLDKGATWNVIATMGSNGFNINATIDAIGLSQSAPNTIYVGDDLGNIFVTNNDGGSWTQINIPSVTDHINELVVDPTNPNSVYAVRDRFGPGKVFHSTNGGATWTDISGNLPDLPTYSLALNTAANTIYVGNDNGVFASNNGGASWAPFGAGMPNVQVVELEFNASLGILAAGTHGRSEWEISTVAGGGGGGGGFGQEPEPNQTSDTAIDFGGLGSGGQTTVTSEGIVPLPDGRNDYDWYRWEMGQAGVFSATEQTTAGSNLELHLFTLVGNTLVELARTTTQGVSSSTLATAVSAGQVILVEVKGENVSFGVMTQGIYNLTATLT